MEWCGVSLDEELSLCVLRGLGARALGRFAQASSDALGAWGKRTSASSWNLGPRSVDHGADCVGAPLALPMPSSAASPESALAVAMWRGVFACDAADRLHAREPHYHTAAVDISATARLAMVPLGTGASTSSGGADPPPLSPYFLVQAEREGWLTTMHSGAPRRRGRGLALQA